jgi:hypothetical protein
MRNRPKNTQDEDGIGALLDFCTEGAPKDFLPVEHSEIYINGTEQGIGNKFKAQVIERRKGHPDEGKVVYETPFAPNLILENGMTAIATNVVTSLFTYCAIGSDSTPTEQTSGAITATTSGTACTSNTAFFNSGMVGQLIYFPGTGQSATITVFTDNQHVTLNATLGIASGLVFDIFAINQTGLGAEIKRTNNYLTGSGNCGTTYSGGVYTHQRTYDFSIETGTVVYNEVGFSSSASAGANLNMRGIFSTAPITVVAGQQLRVIYYVLVTVTPISPRARTVPISGWPALEYDVAFSSATNLVTLVGYGFPLNTQVFFDGTLNPGGVTFGTTYYVIPNDANTFYISTTPSGSQVTITSDGTDVVLYTNTSGNEQLSGDQFSAVDTNGNVTSGGVGSIGEPSVSKNMAIDTNNGAIASYNSTQVAVTPPTGGTSALAQASYVSGSYVSTWSCTFSAENGNSSSIWRLVTYDPASISFLGLIYLFNFPQEKSNLYTLTIVWQYSWNRIFV